MQNSSEKPSLKRRLPALRRARVWDSIPHASTSFQAIIVSHNSDQKKVHHNQPECQTNSSANSSANSSGNSVPCLLVGGSLQPASAHPTQCALELQNNLTRLASMRLNLLAGFWQLDAESAACQWCGWRWQSHSTMKQWH